jgi:hypothetical protein
MKIRGEFKQIIQEGPESTVIPFWAGSGIIMKNDKDR